MSRAGDASAVVSRLLYPIAETEQLLGISHATVYRLVRAGHLDLKKIGGKSVITAESIDRFVAGLPSVRGDDH
jgi:excisionase family DNA binding protein